MLCAECAPCVLRQASTRLAQTQTKLHNYTRLFTGTAFASAQTSRWRRTQGQDRGEDFSQLRCAGTAAARRQTRCHPQSQADKRLSLKLSSCKTQINVGADELHPAAAGGGCAAAVTAWRAALQPPLQDDSVLIQV